MSRYYEYIIRVGVGAVFAASGLLKLIDVGSFFSSVRSFGMIPDDAVPLFSSLIILAETVCGTALIFDLRRKEVTTMLFILMIMFTTAAVKALWSGSESSCGCFGQSSAGVIDGRILVRNGGLILLIVQLNRWNKGKDIRISNPK